MNILELCNIKKKYDNGEEIRQVINDISLELREGDFISIMGPSGSGKSTLLYIMSGILPCDSGKVLFLGKQLNEIKEKELATIRKSKMGFVFQQAAFLKNLTILDNILLPAFNSKDADKQEIVAYGKELMKKLSIGDLADRKLSEVSGGQLQRAGICRALMNKPSIVFADEPTGALNSKTSEEIMEIFKTINEQGVAIVLVTHDRRVAAYGNKVLFLVDGQIQNALDLSSDTTKDEKIATISQYMDSLKI